MAAETAGVAAAGVAATGIGLFGYNRANYLYDAEFRFERFNTAREYACAQTEQYRNDLRSLSALTAAKCSTYAGLAALDMALCVALYCAGRLGLHGPSPPGWIMSLWLTANAASFSFMALAIWLALQGNQKASAASVQLLTRKIRLPLPTLKQVDKARKFASEYEQQAFSDMFRVPYLSNNGAPKTDETSAKVAGSANRARSASPGRRSRSSRASTWIREEFETDRAGTVTGANIDGGALPADAAPEHFRLYASVQKEWFQYDVYARTSIFLGFSCFVQSLAFYGLGHIIVELRAFYVSHACVFTIEVLHCLLIRFDIVQNRIPGKPDRLPHWCVWLGPASVFFAAVGMSLDFRTQFSLIAIGFTWVCIFAAFICQFFYALRILELILPDDVKFPLKMEESIGDAWWPSTWRCPSAFAHVLYVVTPPSRLQPGQYDIAREVKEGAAGDTFEAAGVAPAEPSPTAGAAGEGAGEMGLQVQYLDRSFDYFMSDQVFEQISETNKQRVKDLFAQYSAARRQGNSPEAARVFGDCLMGLDAIKQNEGIQEAGAGSGYSSDSGYSSAGSGSSGSSGDEAMKGYSWDGRRLYEPSEGSGISYTKKEKLEPWWMVASIATVYSSTWLFLILAMVIDVFIGDQGLVTAPHWSRPPMSRLSLEPHELGTPIGFPWYSGAKPWIPEQMAWHEEKRHATSSYISPPHTGEEGNSGGHSGVHKNREGHRRLSENEFDTDMLASTLQGIMEMLPGSDTSTGKALPVTWPGFFQPHVLACGPSGVAALTSRGVGAIVSSRAVQQQSDEIAQSFRLGGLTHLPPLLAASWHPEGLHVVSRAGHIAKCPGAVPKDGGIWACAADGPKLPMAPGARLLAAAVAKIGAELHAAMIDEASPDLVALYKLAEEATSWLPVGDVSVPAADVKVPMSAKVSLSFTPDGQIVITTGAGALLRRRLQDGAVMAYSTHPFAGKASTTSQWQGACNLPGDSDMAHLRLRRKESSQAWHPELVTDAFAQGLPPLFQ